MENEEYGKWVRTSDRLPDQNTMVLFVTDDGTGMFDSRDINFGYYYGFNGEDFKWKKYNYWHETSVPANEVTHWTPLPPYPKEG